MQKLSTTLGKLREGVPLKEKQTEIRFPPTGHLHVELYDASGVVPLSDRQLTVEIPDEGTVHLTTDSQARIFHADVPLQDFELKFDGGTSVFVPAVARRADVHRRHVPEVIFAYVDLVLRDGQDRPLAETSVLLSGPGGELLFTTDERGAIAQKDPLPRGDYRVRAGDLEAKLDLPAVRRRQIVVLEKKAP